MQKDYYNILVAGFDTQNESKITNLLRNIKLTHHDIQLDIQTAHDYSNILDAIGESFYNICLLNSELKEKINHQIIDEIQNKLNIQNKNTAIINVYTEDSVPLPNKHDDLKSIKLHNFCIDEIDIEQLNEYWLSFILKTAVDKLYLQKEIKRLSHYDTLTGLLNRNLYLNYLNHALTLAEREKRYCTLIYLDINGFKKLNEQYDFKTGDAILVESAQRIKKTIRSIDIAARLGSDEFAILLENCHPKEAHRIIYELKHAMALPYNINNEKITVQYSIDNASYPDDCSDKTTFLNDVREAHYLAKTE